MIDTIVLRIHDLKKYEGITKYISLYEKDNFAYKFNAKSDFKKDEASFLMFGDTGEIRHLNFRSVIYCASSHYDIAYNINTERNYLEINFSLPKFLHGTNVLQFIDDAEPTTEKIYNKLEKTLLHFFREYFPYTPDYLDIEVFRIDLSYNQIFNSKEDCLKYLDAQKTLNIEHARSDKNKFQSYGGTTIQYITANYTFKIYHKGSEFRKNDFNKLVKQNPKNYDLKHLNEVAQRTLRYELTFRRGGLNYVFKQSVKDNENTIFNHNLQRIQKSRTKQSREFIEDRLANKTFEFRLDSPFNSWETGLKTLMNSLEFPFNFDLFDALQNFFWERVQMYQLGVKSSLGDIYKRIQEHNELERAKNKKYATKETVSHSSQLLLIASLSQYTDITELKNIIPKATYYRYVKKLKELGIPKHSIDVVSPPTLDYSQYWFELGGMHTTFN